MHHYHLKSVLFVQRPICSTSVMNWTREVIKNVITSYSQLVFVFVFLALVTAATIVRRDKRVKKPCPTHPHYVLKDGREQDNQDKMDSLKVIAKAMFQVTLIKQLVNEPVWQTLWSYHKDKAQREVLVYTLKTIQHLSTLKPFVILAYVAEKWNWIYTQLWGNKKSM